ncbi:lysophospholipase L1-like esterase [Saonia flava]|uniref:Lysophospholipase L1-like esterase n=1 Tax=Saonia flava TaxID=523696 RepID=A0A846R6L7_9FLAO|nr:SGNH/GDSL hydrolase family protein [Saonia flava]NJB72419.1 lysophospholipase L1-like esterase [Saonia flava]
MKYLLSLFFLIFFFGAKAQDSDPFKNEVALLEKKYDSLWDSTKETIVFTGSSSVRMWHSLQNMFPGHQIVNTGFGGSQASDLLVHLNSLVLKFNPKKVFIYEGDNDISAKKKPKKILGTIQEIVDKIKQHNPETQVVLISAKPSIARWNLRKKYKNLNRKMSRYSEEHPQLAFSDVWKPMLNKRKLKKDIFIQDGLHMNSKGYAIWYAVIQNFIN